MCVRERRGLSICEKRTNADTHHLSCLLAHVLVCFNPKIHTRAHFLKSTTTCNKGCLSLPHHHHQQMPLDNRICLHQSCFYHDSSYITERLERDLGRQPRTFLLDGHVSWLAFGSVFSKWSVESSQWQIMFLNHNLSVVIPIAL